MKSSLIRPALALALALGLSACGGGGKAEFTVAGTVNGLVYPGLILITNGMEIAVAPPATPGGVVTYAFPNKLEYGDEYHVPFKGPPPPTAIRSTRTRPAACPRSTWSSTAKSRTTPSAARSPA